MEKGGVEAFKYSNIASSSVILIRKSTSESLVGGIKWRGRTTQLGQYKQVHEQREIRGDQIVLPRQTERQTRKQNKNKSQKKVKILSQVDSNPQPCKSSRPQGPLPNPSWFAPCGAEARFQASSGFLGVMTGILITTAPYPLMRFGRCNLSIYPIN